MTAGFADIVIGLQFGDEGKGRIVDALAHEYDVVARFNGGANAGHTVIVGQEKFALAQVPSGVVHQNISLYIGSGCVVDLISLKRELEILEKAGYEVLSRLKISPYATIVQPHHIFIDKAFSSEIGTTGNGIGPAYADRALRKRNGRLLNIRCIDLIKDEDRVLSEMFGNMESLALLEKKDLNFSASTLKEELCSAIEYCKGLISDDPLLLCSKVENGARVLFEGAQSFELDVARGTVPFVTASHTCAAYAFTGGDLPVKHHRKTIGVAKPIMSRVGSGPFLSEYGGERSERYCMLENGKAHTRDFERRMYDPQQLIRSKDEFEVGIALRMLCGEYGTKTGRPRRIGAFDLSQLNQSARANGVSEIYITRCDLLELFKLTQDAAIPAWVPAENRATTKISIPIKAEADFSYRNSLEHLPEPVQQVIELVQNHTSVKVIGIGLGPEREELINL